MLKAIRNYQLSIEIKCCFWPEIDYFPWGGGGTPLSNGILCAAQMGGFLAIFSLEMGPYFAEYSWFLPFLTFLTLFGAKTTFQNKI